MDTRKIIDAFLEDYPHLKATKANYPTICGNSWSIQGGTPGIQIFASRKIEIPNSYEFEGKNWPVYLDVDSPPIAH